MRHLYLFLLAAPLAAQSTAARDSIRDDRRFSFYDRGPYRSGVPRPESILRYAIGESNTQFGLQERVLLAIADAAKDRVKVEEIGMTNERRTMRLFIISSPDNIARIDAIRADLDRLADPRGTTPADLDAIVERVPAVVWINESVHGNESPGFETAMQTLYQLAASEEPATVQALRNVVVVLNPSTNPDGHERFAVWYNSIGVESPDPGSLEKDEPWSIQGRYNHYRFDMNRDVMTTTQREPRALVRGYLRWHPMVAIDQHGQTTNYFFPPTAPPMNTHLVGTAFDRWMEIYGRANAAAFDRYGWMYYSRDVFDFYGPFYWDSWPSLTGAIGMTYETDGGGWKGIRWRRGDGTILSFRDGIAKHYVTAMATIQTTADRRRDRVRDFLAFRQGAIREGQTGPMKRVVFSSGDAVRAADLAATLLRSGIEVRRTTAPFSSVRAHAYADDAVSARRFEAGVYVVDLAQPQGRLARSFLEPAPALDTAFARTQIEKFRRNQRRGANADREGYEFYDVTAWSLPVTFGVDAWWTDDVLPISGELLQLPDESDAAARARVMGEALPVETSGGVTGGTRATSAYLFGPERNGALRLAYHLLSEGFRVAVSLQPVEAGGRQWARGTYIVRAARNDSTLHARIAALARASGVDVGAANSAFNESAQFGIGSNATVDLEAPKVALVGGDGISQTGYGAIWWTLEQRYGMRFTPIGVGSLGGDISRFNVVIVPDASSGALARQLGKSGADALRSWVQRGGTLITMGGASVWAAGEEANLTSARIYRPDTTAKAPATDTTAKADSATARTRVPADTATARQRRRETLPDRTQDDRLAVTSPSASPDAPAPLAGSHFDVVIDRTHWLTHGYDAPRLTVMVDGSQFFRLSKEGTNVAVFPKEGKLLRAGFAFPENTERLMRDKALLIEEPVGAGHVILFANEPMFRAWWRALDRLVLNGVVLGPGM
ncbi:MAG: M14 family zinc carboxypeptidase [Gemmatimonadaceae bacterium]